MWIWNSKGSYQECNKKTILDSTSYTAPKHSPSAMKPSVKGFAHVCELTGLRGRWEKLNDAPLTICDTGHNLGRLELSGSTDQECEGRDQAHRLRHGGRQGCGTRITTFEVDKLQNRGKILLDAAFYQKSHPCGETEQTSH